MKKLVYITITCIILSLNSNGQSSQDYLVKFGKTEKAIEIFNSASGVFLITTKSVYYEKKHHWKYIELNTKICSAYLSGNNLYIGTSVGVKVINTKNYQIITPHALDSLNAKIVSITGNNRNEVFLGTETGTVYKYSGNSLHEILKTSYINCMNTTPDSSLWIGTNVGLIRIWRDNIYRYLEEGVANFEIPDNIVERLIFDSSDRLWIIMSEGISMIEFTEDTQHTHKDEHDHLPSLSYIGSKNNEVLDLLKIEKGYLFVTTEATFFLPVKQADDIFEKQNESDRVEPSRLLIDITGKLNKTATPKQLTSLSKHKIMIADDIGLYILNSKKLRSGSL